jgi:hypothetical protein
MKFDIAHTCGDGKDLLQLVLETQKSGGIIATLLEEQWIVLEAYGYGLLGNPSHALALCTRANELAIAVGLDGSERHLYILDIQAEMHLQKSEYTQAHKIQTLVTSKTSPNRSPRYHANALATLAHLDITRASGEIEILRNLNDAKAVYNSLDPGSCYAHG